ncbi:CBS domain-containing protein [Marinobacterium sp. D7]|uniref:CBS domain-containing protein n=1 Tax=Marinobacterium ramblicola TaxID=2849041 RepID=UPI001C2D5488|nr:CBS domain-containing protein [Marinobacterium ramblicola]MBV1786840.1 CBS domain-containing protein [Marinobacterium ramblicola]
MHPYHELKTVGLSDYPSVIESDQVESFDLNSPARLVMTDFLYHRPLTLLADVSIDDAIAAMRRAHVRSILVTDTADAFRGIITVADLESRKVLSLATSSGQARGDLTIGDLMTPKEKLRGVTLGAVEKGSIGDLLQTLKNEGQPHMLVVDPDSQRIRGIISSSDIARRLRISVELNLRATSFRELVDIISSGREVG